MGCALNSGAPSWQCFHGFMRDTSTPVAPAGPEIWRRHRGRRGGTRARQNPGFRGPRHRARALPRDRRRRRRPAGRQGNRDPRADAGQSRPSMCATAGFSICPTAPRSSRLMPSGSSPRSACFRRRMSGPATTGESVAPGRHFARRALAPHRAKMVEWLKPGNARPWTAADPRDLPAPRRPRPGAARDHARPARDQARRLADQPAAAILQHGRDRARRRQATAASVMARQGRGSGEAQRRQAADGPCHALLDARADGIEGAGRARSSSAITARPSSASGTRSRPTPTPSCARARSTTSATTFASASRVRPWPGRLRGRRLAAPGPRRRARCALVADRAEFAVVAPVRPLARIGEAASRPRGAIARPATMPLKSQSGDHSSSGW